METFSALLAIYAENLPVPVNSPHKGQWRGALMFSLIYAWINRWVNKGEAGDLRRFRAHYDGIVMLNTKVTLHVFSHFPCNKRKWKSKIVWSRMIFPQCYFIQQSYDKYGSP